METYSSVETHDECDDDEGFIIDHKSEIEPTFVLQLDSNLIDQTKIIVFAEGVQAINFSKSYFQLQNLHPVGKLVKNIEDQFNLEGFGLHYEPPKPSLFYQINESTLLCTCSPTMYTEDHHSFSKMVMNRFCKLANVVIITVLSISSFKGDKGCLDDNPFLVRTLSSSSFKYQVQEKNLEQPNLLEGVAAGLLTVCELSKISAVVCAVFTSSLKLEKDMIDGFTTFFRSLESIFQTKFDSSTISPTETACIETGNLYT